MTRPDIVALARSFRPRQWFPHGFDMEDEGKIMWVYRPDENSDHERWIVGFFYPDGGWFTEATFDNKEQAAARVNWLNGGKE